MHPVLKTGGGSKGSWGSAPQLSAHAAVDEQEKSPRNSQDLWMRFSDRGYAATSVSCWLGRSTITPLSKLAPARTSATRWGALTDRHRSWAASISL